MQARDMPYLPASNQLSLSQKRALVEAYKERLINILYHDGIYYLQEPFHGRKHRREPDVVIEKQCWVILKYLPKMRTEIHLNDVIRFGRVSFKVTELVLTQSQIEQSRDTLE